MLTVAAKSEVCVEKPLILIIDDDYQVRSSVVKLLNRGDNYHILEAADAHAAQALLSRGDGPIIDLILCDVDMPFVPGHEFHFQNAEFLAEHNIGFLAMTGGERSEAIRYFTEKNVPIIRKPFHSREFLAIIEARLTSR